jgi:hypothetical protein
MRGSVIGSWIGTGAGVRGRGGGCAADGGEEGPAASRRELLEHGVGLDGEELGGDERDELAQGGAEGDEGPVGVVGAGVDGADGDGQALGQVIGVAGEVLGQFDEVEGGEGVGVVAGLEGVEVATRRAAAARAEFGVAVRAAQGMAAHGPALTAGILAARFVPVSGHGVILQG